eukprot:gb/GECG01005396.1/.p1 GENE.gb/GECG01005396.1/~~gb/GECG01005396.1/.p1  ORF type:complete len:166 (+),score=28.04 gb/GECG01005396.1/:1-498(+)
MHCLRRGYRAIPPLTPRRYATTGTVAGATPRKKALESAQEDEELLQRPKWSVRSQLSKQTTHVEEELTDARLAHIAELSMLLLPSSSTIRDSLKQDLNSILQAARGMNRWVKERQHLRGTNTAETHPLRSARELREDTIIPEEEKGEELIRLSASREGNYYAVPK